MSGGISLCKNVKDLHASPRLARSTALEGAIFDAQVIGPRACSPPSPHVQCVCNPRGRNRIASSNPAKLLVFLLERRLLHPFTYLLHPFTLAISFLLCSTLLQASPRKPHGPFWHSNTRASAGGLHRWLLDMEDLLDAVLPRPQRFRAPATLHSLVAS